MHKPDKTTSFRDTKTYHILKNLLFFLVIFVLIQAWQQRNMVTGKAPDFQAELLDGETITLDTYRGKPLLLHFWSTTCPICRLEEDSITGLYKHKDTQILTVAFYSGGKDEVNTYINQHNLQSWAVVLDPQGELGNKFGVYATPSSFYIDADGNIKYKTIGFTSKWGMQIRLWLAGL